MTTNSELTAPATTLPLRLAQLSLLLFAAAAAAVALTGAGGGRVAESQPLLTILNTLFGVAISLLIAQLAGRSFLQTGRVSHLSLCAGASTFAIAYLLPAPLLTGALPAAVTVHNTGVLLAGACYLASARLALREPAEERGGGSKVAVLAFGVAAPAALMALVLLGALGRVLPDFFVAGRGMTPLRQLVLVAAVAEFALAALGFAALYRRRPSAFLLWYSLGLALIGLGLGAMIPAGPPGTVLGWLGRTGQYLGSLYLFFAVLGVGREDGDWRLPLEQELSRSKQELSSLFDLFAVGMAYGDPVTGRPTRVNEKLCEIVGYSREELHRMTWAELTHPEDRARDRAAIEGALRGETRGWSSLKRYVRKDGAVVWVQVDGGVQFDADGRPSLTTAVVQDVTARHAAEVERERLGAELKRGADELDAVFKALPFLVSVIGPDGRHERVNPAMVRLFGFDPAATPRDEVARRLRARFPDGTPLTVQNMPSSRALRGESVDDVEYVITDSRGEDRTLLMNAVPLVSDGAVYGAVLAQRDVTAERAAEKRIRHLASFPELNPTPVVEFDLQGRVTFRNPAAREALRGLGLADDARLFLPAGFEAYLEQARRGGGQAEFSREVSVAGRIFGERLQLLPALGVVRVFARDMTELKAVEEDRARLFERLELAHAELERKVQERTADLHQTIQRLRVTSDLLQLFQRVVTRQEYLDAVVGVLKDWSGCECVGIRIDDGAGRLAYEAQIGFDAEFLENEASLSLESLDCVCTRTARGAARESDRAHMTAAGSFRCDDTPRFSLSLDARQRAGYRGHCFRRGFASLAAIPIRYRDLTRGLIHLADRRPGAIPPATVDFLEYVVPLIGEAVHRYDTEAELERHRSHLEELVERRTQELQRTTAELERSNSDLDQFASAVSHDLKEPLRAVAGYASLLQGRCAGRFDEKADAFLAGAVDGAERMRRLIDDLLSYARVGTRGRELAPVDAETAFAIAVENLTATLEESGAVLTHDPLPTVRSDQTQLAQLFQNLVANAARFRGAAAPRIHLGAAREPGAWRFWVRDNGIGLEPRHRERVFEIFQRLHSRSAYPGTGIGLAICKRIVERHGGRIWVDSEPGAGATFWFTIPDQGGEPR
jgi:PAS domain S-box-containing protein